MDLVQPWLVATIGTEFSKALECRDSVENARLPCGDVSGSSFEDDGSNLRIKPAILGQTLQISKFLDCFEPVRATLSDSVTRINVSFATTASQKHEKETRQRLSQGSLGGVLQLLDFELVATPYGPRSSRLTLFIKDFNILGSAGSGEKGVPRPIEDAGDISVLLEKLSRQRKGLDQSESQGPSTRQSLPRASFVQSPLLNDDLSRDTRPGDEVSSFATQISRAHLTKQSLEVPIRNGDGALAIQTGTLGSNAHSVYKVKPQALRSASNAELLSILPLKPRIGESASGSPAARNVPTEQTQALVDLQAVATPNNRGTNTIASEIEPLQPPANVTTTRTIESNLALKKYSEVGAPASPKPVSIMVSAPRLPDPFSLGPSAGLGNDSVITSGAALPRDSPNAHLRGTSQRRKRDRIRIRDVRISKEQDILLSRSDSWLPAEPGQREPVANVPIVVLNALNKKADQKAELSQMQTSRSPSRAVNADNPQVGTDSNIESEGALPWSSSPNPGLSDSERLPPDSSANQSDQVITRDSTRDTTDAIRYPSQSSTNIHFEGWVRSEPKLKAVAALVKTHEIATSESLSSSPLSDDEDARLYQCRGCKKSYRKVSGLTYHIKHAHCGQETLKSVGRPENSLVVSPSDACLEAKKQITPPFKETRLQLNGAVHGIKRNGAEGADGEALSNETSKSFPDPDVQHNIRRCRDLGASSYISKTPTSDKSTTATGKRQINPQRLASSDSELETIIPPTLNSTQPQQEYDAFARCLPSTTSQPQVPFTQVKTTPYVDGQIRDGAHNMSHHPASSWDKHDDSRISRTPLETTRVEELSEFTVPEVSGTAEDVTYLNGRSTHDRAQEQTQGAAADGIGPKRKTSTSSDLPTKENKRPKRWDAFRGEMINDGERLNPSDLARHYRREFFTSRIRSESSPAKAGFVSSKGGDVGTSITSHVRGLDVVDLKAAKGTAKIAPTNSLEDPWDDNRTLTENHAVEHHLSLTKSDLNDVRTGAQDKEEPIEVDKPQLMDLGVTTACSACTEPSNAADAITSNEKLAKVSIADADANTRISQLSTGKVENSQSHMQGLDTNSGHAPINCHHQHPDDDTLSKGIVSPSQVQEIELQQYQMPSVANSSLSPSHKEPPPGKQAQNAETRITESGAPARTNVFDRFKATYPDYLGDVKHFKTLCSKIDRLFKDKNCLPQFLWDDFIIRQKTEYPKYVQQCAEEAEDPLPYDKYYLTMTEGPTYMKKVVTVRTLGEAVGPEKQRAWGPNISKKDGDADVGTIKPLQPRSTPPQLGSGPRKQAPDCITIDLTADDQLSHSQQTAKDEMQRTPSSRRSTSHRSLPWSKVVENRDSSSDLPHIETKKRRRGSHQLPTPIYESYLARRQRLSLGDDGGSEEAKLEVEDPYMRNFRRRIQTAWGIEAEDVLRPRFVDARSKDDEDTSPISKEQLRLLADIAESTDLERGRAVLHAEYLALARCKTDKAPPKLTDEVLDAVLRRLYNQPVDHFRVSPVLGDSIQDGAGAWWQDEDTPFKSFVRNYNSIQPGKGNSYARAGDIERGKRTSSQNAKEGRDISAIEKSERSTSSDLAPMAVELETLLCPITALAFLELDQLCLIVGEGQHLKIFDYKTGKLHLIERIFVSQAIHGLTCTQSQATAPDYTAILVWGGRSLYMLRIPKTNASTDDRPLRMLSSMNEIGADDWILDAQLRPQCFENVDSFAADKAALITAHNELHLLICPNHTSSGELQGQSLRRLSSGPRSILYSAHLSWADCGRIIVASGTVTGEIVVWSVLYQSKTDFPTTCRVHYTLPGHEGSVFGVRISEPLSSNNSTTTRILASCSDDRTIRIWDISGVDSARSSGSAGICLAKVMGHASRIWSIRFLMRNQSTPKLLSFGEDGTAQIWQIHPGKEKDTALKSSGHLTMRLAHEATSAFHSGRNVWTAAIHLEYDGSYLAATGGADGRIVSYRICMNNSTPNDYTLYQYTIAEALNSRNTTTKDAATRPEASKTVISKIYDKMIGRWNLARIVNSAIPTQPSGSLQGVATVTPREVTDDAYDAESVYFEQGDFTSDLGFTMRATRQYVYRYQRCSDTISVWFVKPDGASVDYLFHNLDFEFGESPSIDSTGTFSLCASGHHLCERDHYSPGYVFSFHDWALKEWNIRYTVKGPQKDYVSKATYTLPSRSVRREATTASPDVGKIKRSAEIGKPSKPDAFKGYAWISKTEFLTTTEQGDIMLGAMIAGTDGAFLRKPILDSVRHIQANFAWEFLGSLDDLVSASLITSCVPRQVAFFTGNGGTIYAYNHNSQRINVLQRGTVKLGYLQAHLAVDADGRGPLLLLTRSRGSHAPDIYQFLSGEPVRATIPNQLCAMQQDDPIEDFVTTGWCVDEYLQLLVEGSRNGKLRFHERSGRTRQTLSNVHSGNAVTVVIWLFDKGSAKYFLTAGRDGKYAIHKWETGIHRGPPFKFKTLHVGSPSFGPNIEGARVSPVTKNIVLWGFSSTRFVVWNETQKSEIMSVECGGSHRNWDYFHHDETNGGNFVWTQASACNVYCQARPSHRVLQSGGHGRETKAMVVSPSIAEKEGESKTRLIATGAEDTAIRLFKHEDGVFKCLNVITEHTSGIQKLQWSLDGRWLFSAGGCEQFFAWRVRMLNGTPTTVCEGRCPQLTDEKYLRIMDFNVTAAPRNDKVKASKSDYIIHIAYSDSSIRIWRFRNRYCEGSANSQRFILLFKTSLPCEHLILSGGDDQALAITRITTDLKPSAGESSLARSATLLIPNAHASAITGIAILGSRIYSRTLRFASVGSDQRLKTWLVTIDQSRGDGVAGVDVSKVGDVYTSVADASSLDAYKDEDEGDDGDGVWRILVAGIGMEAWKVDAFEKCR
ncbi:MAG: hypothetical protein Q9217_001938 [Psora testacea]